MKILARYTGHTLLKPATSAMLTHAQPRSSLNFEAQPPELLTTTLPKLSDIRSVLEAFDHGASVIVIRATKKLAAVFSPSSSSSAFTILKSRTGAMNRWVGRDACRVLASS